MSKEFSGTLDQRITLQLPIDSTDDGGGNSRSWQNLVDIWSHIASRPQDERRYAGHISTRNRYQILIRRDGDIPLAARLLWGKRILTILAVEDDPDSADRTRIIAEQEREQ
jgi:SPP1 family predicted phage head-tail adaptor